MPKNDVDVDVKIDPVANPRVIPVANPRATPIEMKGYVYAPEQWVTINTGAQQGNYGSVVLRTEFPINTKSYLVVYVASGELAQGWYLEEELLPV